MKLQGTRILLGITGGIAAYKTPLLVRQLVKSGADVRVVMTHMAQEFVTPVTLQVVSQNPVGTDGSWLDEANAITHIRWAETSDLAVVAPATANCLGKIAAGIADDLLTSLLLAVTCPIVLVPSMHHQMWANPIVQANVTCLRGYGFHLLEPAAGDLASGDTGPGRMPEPEQIVTALEGVTSS